MPMDTLHRPAAAADRHFATAQVVSRSGDAVIVRFPDDPADRKFAATPAIADPEAISPGRSVLVAGDDRHSLFIIGILAAPQPSAPLRHKLPDGGHVEMPATSADSLKIFTPTGQIILEYSPSTLCTRVHAGAGGLEFSAPDADITLRSGKRLNLQADSVQIQARSRVDIGIVHVLRGVLSRMLLQDQTAAIHSPRLQMQTAELDINADKTTLAGDDLSLQTQNTHCKTGRAELTAETIITKFQNAYHHAEELYQLCTRRLRTVVRDTWHCRSQNTYLSTREDFKVKADQIHLG